MYYSEFLALNERNSGHSAKMRLIGYNAKTGVAEYVRGGGKGRMHLSAIVDGVNRGVFRLSNPSFIKGAFPKERVYLKEVQIWHDFYGNNKGAISKILDEYGASLRDFKRFCRKGYDSLIVYNAPVGIENKITIPREIVVFDTSIIEIVPNGTTGNDIAYHNTTATFDKFSLDYVGTCHGACYGEGIYFSSEPVLEYGRTITARLHIKKAYEIKDLNNIREVHQYVNTVLT